MSFNHYDKPGLFTVCEHCGGTGNASGSYTPDDAHEPARCPECLGQGRILRPECQMTCASIEDEYAAVFAEWLATDVPVRRDELMARMVMLEDVLEMEGCDDGQI